MLPKQLVKSRLRETIALHNVVSMNEGICGEIMFSLSISPSNKFNDEFFQRT